MDITQKNGQPSMEEILASIRRIIAEEPAGAAQSIDFNRRPIMLRQEGDGEEATEFDLPAIFRQSASPQPEKPTPLLGRLTDAIRNATTANGERIVPQPSEAGSDGAGPVGASGSQAEAAPHQSLSSLKILHGEAGKDASAVDTTPFIHEGQVGAATAAAAEPPVSAGQTSGEGVRRVMAPFKDTMFLRLADPQGVPSPVSDTPAPISAAPVAPEYVAPAAPSIAAAETSAPSPAVMNQREPDVRPVAVDFAAIIPQRLDRGGLVGRIPGEPIETAPAPSPLRPVEAAPIASPVAPLTPPPLQGQALLDTQSVGQPTSTAPSSAPVGTIEDATADLLRPMLRQWLAENMPRMVEKALHIEVAESVKGVRKPTDQT